MNWEKPAFIEVDMSAEIGGYQGDEGQGPNGPDYMPDFIQGSHNGQDSE
jgi:coenzyme PQQ precursor peptide PqqA